MHSSDPRPANQRSETELIVKLHHWEYSIAQASVGSKSRHPLKLFSGASTFNSNVRAYAGGSCAVAFSPCLSAARIVLVSSIKNDRSPVTPYFSGTAVASKPCGRSLISNLYLATCPWEGSTIKPFWINCSRVPYSPSASNWYCASAFAIAINLTRANISSAAVTCGSCAGRLFLESSPPLINTAHPGRLALEARIVAVRIILDLII